MKCVFKPEELVKAQGKLYPVVGARLRLMHEDHLVGNVGSQYLERVFFETEILEDTPQRCVVECTLTTRRGKFIGLGTANDKKDARLKDALLEMAQTRSIARALRWAGYGVEYTGIEELGPENGSFSIGDCFGALSLAAEDGLDAMVDVWRKHNKQWKSAATAEEWRRIEAHKEKCKGSAGTRTDSVVDEIKTKNKESK